MADFARERPGAQRRFLRLAAKAAALVSWPWATCVGDQARIFAEGAADILARLVAPSWLGRCTMRIGPVS